MSRDPIKASSEAFVSAAWEVVKAQTELIELLQDAIPIGPTPSQRELVARINRALAAMRASHPR